jgi:TRAP-type C4-dicarboxylate transport system permease large subunit
MQQVWRAVTPYVLMGVAGLALLLAFPPLATWLPKVLIK